MASLDALENDADTKASRQRVQESAEAIGLRLVSFEITHEPIPDPAIEALPAAERKRIEQITHRMYDDAAPLVSELEGMVARYPHIAMLRNHLAGALNAADEYERATEVIAEMVRVFPDYVFGFANHVLALLNKKRIDEARTLLEDGPRGTLLMLPLFDPSRTLFHATEVICYTAMVGHYLIATDRLEGARTNLEMCREIDPDHPQTAALEEKIKYEEFMGRLKQAAAGTFGRRAGSGKKKK